MTAILYYEDGAVREVSPENGNDFKLGELQAMVEGDIQIVPLEGEKLLVCNEEGKLNGVCKPNIRATMEWIKFYGETDVMYGNVLICDPEMIE